MKTPIILKAAVAVAVGLLLFSCTKKTELSLSTKSLTFDADITVAQPQTVTVTTNAAWHASKTADWLYIDPVSGPESGKFTVSVVNFNKELSDRTAQITVVADDLTEVITVTQKALVPVLSVAANGWDINAPIPAKGTGARQLVITSNVPWTLTVTGGGDWFTYAPDSGNENGYVSMGWHANYEFEERSVKLDFSAAGGQTASITFKQLAAEPSEPGYGGVADAQVHEGLGALEGQELPVGLEVVPGEALREELPVPVLDPGGQVVDRRQIGDEYVRFAVGAAVEDVLTVEDAAAFQASGSSGIHVCPPPFFRSGFTCGRRLRSR